MLDFNLQPESRISKVEQIVQMFINHIERGNLQANEKLPSINAFAKKQKISRDTIEKAYTRLRVKGYIASTKGLGFFVAAKRDNREKILFIFNKLSSYKKIIYDSFLETLGDRAIVDVFVHHYSPALLKRCLNDASGKYDYYVVMPHFFQQAKESEYLEVLRTIPEKQLILLDKNIPHLSANPIGIYQDFKLDIYEALISVAEMVRKYSSITILFPEHQNHPIEIIKGVEEYCNEQDLGFSMVSHPDLLELCKHTVYIILTESDLSIMIKKIRNSEFILGQDIGVISFNETVLKELLDITVVTTNFENMGRGAAELIKNRRHNSIRNSFDFIKRQSF